MEYIPTFTMIYHKNQPNVGKYTIHGSYGIFDIHFLTYHDPFTIHFTCPHPHPKGPSTSQLLLGCNGWLIEKFPVGKYSSPMDDNFLGIKNWMVPGII